MLREVYEKLRPPKLAIAVGDEVSGKKYFYLETTGEGFEIGQIPTAYQVASAYVYPVE
jgi:hypothetical protein